MEKHITETQEFRALQLRLKYLLNGGAKLKPGLGKTLLALDAWIGSLYTRGFDAALTDVAGPELTDGQEVIGRIVDHLLDDVDGAEHDLLQKSLLETFLSLFGLDPDLQLSVFRDRLCGFLDAQGPCALVRHFLALHVFNMVWFQTMDSFRGLARTHDHFMKDMQALETACAAAVEVGWDLSHVDHPLEANDVGVLLREIEKHLLGEDGRNA
jgi:hypothetical protein